MSDQDKKKEKFCLLIKRNVSIFFCVCAVDRIKKRVARAGHLLNTHPELRTVIASPKTCVSSTMPSPRNGTKDENTDERKRKLARMEIVRDMLGADKKAATVVVSIAPHHHLFSFSPSFSILHSSFEESEINLDRNYFWPTS